MAAPGGSEDPQSIGHDAQSANSDSKFSADSELLQSLNQLSITGPDARSPSRNSSTSPNPTVRTLSRLDQLSMRSSPSPRLRSPAPRSPVARSVSGSDSHSPSRSATPTLLRKTSSSSLRSVSVATNRAPSRRSSSTLLSPAGARSSVDLGSYRVMEEEYRIPKTEALVAHDYFVKELDTHHISDPRPKSETLVILQDACFKHRYQRPFAGKNNLATIVERPERLQAVYTGVAMAYVRLGERHQDGKCQITPELDPATLQVPFDIRKTDRKMSLSSPAVTNVHGPKWMEELLMLCGSAKSKLDAGTLEIQRPDMDRGPGAKAPEPFHRGDLYLSPDSLMAFEGALGATCDAVDAVFSDSPTKRAFVAVRPPGHHCDAHWPHGFCWLNNVQVGIMHGFLNHGLTHAAIIDFDLHHGDGSQDIAWDYNYRKHWSKGHAAQWKKNSIGYFSLHDIQSYPCEEGDPEAVKKASLCIEDAFSQTIWNVHLQQWKDHPDFWYQYRTRIVIVLDKARAYLRREAEKFRAMGQEPRAAIFFSAGFDASEYESPGMQRHKVNVPTEFYARISRDVVRMSFEDGLAVDGRIVSCLEGGYSDRALSSGVLAHLSGLAGGELRAKEETNGLSHSGSRRISLSASPLGRRSTISSTDSDPRSKTAGFPYESSWWTASELDRLDAARTVPRAEPRQYRQVTPPTYSSPTQSSNAKVSELAKSRRSVSGLPSPGIVTQFVPRAPSPPPPTVQWPTATLELSKLLIPTNSQVDSISWDTLKSEETRIKKEQKEQKLREQREREVLRSSEGPSEVLNEPVNVPVVRKSGRERKPVSYVEPEDFVKNRRRTVAGSAVIATEKSTPSDPPAVPGYQHSRQPSRRLSASSAMSLMTTEPVAPALPAEASASHDSVPPPEAAPSIRPDTSHSTATTTGALQVAKIRPTATRKDSTKSTASAPRKPKVAAPKAPNAKGKAVTTTSRTSARSSKPSSPARAQGVESGPSVSSSRPPATPRGAVADSGNELANITNGMRKIKINVVTKEMKEAREQAAKGKSSAASTPVIEEPQPPLGSFKVEEDTYDMSVIPTEHNPSGQIDKDTSSDPTIDHPPMISPPTLVKEDEQLVRPVTPAEVGPATPTFKTPAGIASESNLFIPYQPEGETPRAIPQTAPTKWMPPNTVDTPAPFRGHNFTATSAIPFSAAKPKRAAAPVNPFHPNFAQRSVQHSEQANYSANTPIEVESTGSPDYTREMSTETTDSANTWDTAREIPETPEHSR